MFRYFIISTIIIINIQIEKKDDDDDDEFLTYIIFFKKKKKKIGMNEKIEKIEKWKKKENFIIYCSDRKLLTLPLS